MLLDAAENEDVDMASQNPGIVQLELSVQEGAHIDLTLISGDGNCTT